MKARPGDPGWPASRLAVAIVLLASLQAFVVLRLAHVPAIPLHAVNPIPRTTLLWHPAQIESAFAGVPANRRDLLERDPSDPFQSVAKRSSPKADYRLAEFREPTRWLTNPPSLPHIAAPPVPPSPLPSSPIAAHPPVSVPGASPGSTLVIPGQSLAQRRWLKPPVLGPWQGTEIPGTTRLDVAANPQGWIVLVRVSESSGSREADESARRAIKEALLSPEPNAARRPTFAANELQWGSFTVEWALPPSQP